MIILLNNGEQRELTTAGAEAYLQLITDRILQQLNGMVDTSKGNEMATNLREKPEVFAKVKEEYRKAIEAIASEITETEVITK